MILERIIWICITFCTASVRSLAGNSWKQAAASPIIQHKPFVVVWNIPTIRCQEHFGIRLPLDIYGIVENKGNVFHGQNITIFYKNKFGLYPYISPQGDWHNGGIPQKVNLKKHLEKATKEITELLNNNFQGLAVVDWEEWRPLWRRNWAPKMVYREASKQWVRKRFRGLSPEEQTQLAKVEFEEAARVLMETTLALGKKLRPHGFWGFYRFPDCFNKWGKEENYTGQCDPKEVLWNDQLMWLWKISSALYPSIYLPLKVPALYRQHYIHHRLGEAFRVAQFGTEHPLPVLPYSRVSYRNSSKYLTEADLVNTIGESAALGSAGVVLWGDLSYSRSLESCKSLLHYITTTLGPYVVNVTTAANRCSHQLCHGNGRCVRCDLSELGAFLHLDHQLWEGDLGITDFQEQNMSMQDHFQCQCYPKWAGTHCERPQTIEPFEIPKPNQASRSNNVNDAVHDGDFDLGSNICPTSIYETPVEEPASSDTELVEHEMEDINLHTVESISDLHYASIRSEDTKASEGNNQSQATTPGPPHKASFKHFSFPNEDNSAFSPAQNFHLLSAFTCCPCFRPACCPTAFFALLGLLVMTSLGLATLAVYLSVLQRESLRNLAQWLESQEEALRQMRAVSLQIWRQLNASEVEVQT